MNRVSFLCLVILISYSGLTAQRFAGSYPLQGSSVQLEFGVALQRGSPFFAISAPRLAVDPKLNIGLASFGFEGADLEARLTLPRVKKPFSYRVAGHLLADPAVQAAFRAQEPRVDYTTEGVTLTWADAPELGLFPRRSYEIRLTAELMGDVDCNALRPRYTFAENWPYWTGVSAGLVALGVGELEDQRKRKRYTDYRSDWEDGAAQSDETIRLLNTANQARDRANTYTAIGVAVTGLSSAALLVRYLRMQKKRATYDRYCTNEEPSLPSPRLSLFPLDFNTGVGIGLLYNF